MRITLLFFSLFLSYASGWAEEENFSLNENTASVSALEGLPSSVVGGAVCAISGLYIDHSVDFVLAGPESLVFERTYSSSPLKGNMGMGWNSNHRDWLEFKRSNHKNEDVRGCFLVEPSGARLFYKRPYDHHDDKHSRLSLDLEDSKGLTNGSRGEISGRTNYRNQKLYWHPKEDKLVCYSGTKSCRTFHPDINKNFYGISSEKKVNGSTYRYDLAGDPFMHTSHIVCYNSKNKKLYSDIRIKSKENKGSKHASLYLSTSHGHEIEYEYFKHNYKKTIKRMEMGPQGLMYEYKEHLYYMQPYLTKVFNPCKPLQEYKYTKRHEGEGYMISKKAYPQNRYLTINYCKDGHKKDSVGDIKAQRNRFCIDRVQSLEAPVGTTEEPITTHRFIYDISVKKNKEKMEECADGSTHVLDAYGHRVSYHYNKDHLLESIIKYIGTDKRSIYCKENFIWGRKTNKGNLKARYLTNPQNKIICFRSYLYDSFGNILEDSFYGCLTGRKKVSIVLDEEKKPVKNGCECDTKICTYSQNGLNLKLSEKDSNGVKTIYSYRPKTDLLTARYIVCKGKILSREFLDYDENNAVCRTIMDNGDTYLKGNLQGVTQRQLIKYQNTTEKPIGLPAEEAHYYLDLDSHQTKLLKRVVSQFTKEGWVQKQDVYDADDVYRYSKEWEYDAHGNVIKEVNPLGHVTLKEYDENDNLILQMGPQPGFCLKNSYDFMNRLIRQEEIHADGQSFATAYEYDYLSNCTAKVNTYGLETRFEYDDFNRVTAIFEPSLLNEKGEWVQPVTRTKYNIAGHPVSVKNAADRTTLTKYNTRGQPLRIDYPDGTFESFFYRLDGKLEYKRSRTGIQTYYTLDPLGRIIEEADYSPNDELLKKTSSEYDSTHLIKSVDVDGMETHYTYDGAGRLTWILKGDVKSQTLYDALGRPYEIREWYGDGPHEYRASIKEYDLLDRLTEERLEDYEGHVFHLSRYEYDINGNQTLVQVGDQKTLTFYNGSNNPIKIVNAIGDETHTAYKSDFINNYGQRVLQTITTDPLGFQIIDTYDAANRLVKTARRNPFGVLLSQQENFYDLSGNLCRVEDALIEKEEIKSVIATVRTYSLDNQITSLIEAQGTPEQKATYYQYNRFGHLAAITKPDGTRLRHEYDALGRLKKFYSSDESFSYAYQYNLKDQVTSVQDLLTGQTTALEYDHAGRLIKEAFAHGHSIAYEYDYLGRAHTIHFPDKSTVQYVYNAVDLKEAHRLIDGQRLYSHLELKHNLAGQVEKVQLPGQNGEATYRYDLMGRCIQIETAAYRQEVPINGYDQVGNLRSYQVQDQIYEFDYDDLNQLTSESGHNQHAYQFNSLANRISKDGEEHIYNALHQLIQKGKEKFKYDSNGNLIERDLEGKITSYAYDALDRLISINREGVRTDYYYDSFNRRIAKKREGSEEQLFLYMGQEEIGLWQQGSLKEFRLLVKNHISATAAIELNGKLYVPCHSLSGNITCLLDEQGAVVERYRYTAFGECEILSPQGELRAESIIGNPWQYASKRLDSETGFIAFGLRYYDAELGRWITPDPAGFGDGPNLYAYVHNSPLRYADQFGLFSFDYNSSIISAISSQWGNYCPIESHFASQLDFERQSYFASAQFSAEEMASLTPIETTKAYDFNELGQINPKTGEVFKFKETKNMVGFVNGIMNRFNQSVGSMGHLAQLTDHNVKGVHSASFGFARDQARYFLARQGIASETSREIQNLWYDYFKDNPNGHVFWVCHSRGVVDTRNALIKFPEELRNRIHILAVAPGCYIDRHLCGSITHLVCPLDPVPYLDNVGMIRCIGTINFLLPKEFGSPHSFNSETYTDAIQRKYEKFCKDYP